MTLKSGLGSDGAGVVEDLLIGIQGFAGPVADGEASTVSRLATKARDE